MAAVDFLPIAQPAARPDAAVARKSASAPDENGEASFAEVLETEADAAGKAKTPADANAAADDAPADAAPAPSPHAAPALVHAHPNAAVFAAALQAPMSAATPVVEPAAPDGTIAAAVESTSPAIDIDIGITAGGAPIPPPAATPPGVSASAPVEVATTAPTPPGSTTPLAREAGPLASATESVPAIARAKAGPAKPVVAEDPSSESAVESPADAAAGSATERPAATKPEHPASPAPSVVAATPASDIAVQTVAAVVGGQTPAPKPVAQPTPSENAPGQRRKTADADSIAPATDTSPSTAKPAAQPAQPGASSAQPANGNGKSPIQIGSADPAAPDVNADAGAPTSTSASTSSNSPASFADALAAARGSSVDAGRAQAANPHLQSGPSAAVQVYARFIERFDGRAQRFEVRLDPAELGRVDVRIEVGADKKVHAVLAAHDSAALSDLMRGQRSLERALSDAGIDLADNGLRFELSQDAGRNLAGQQRGDGWSNDELAQAWRAFSTVDVAVDANPADIAAATRAYSSRSSRLDLVA